MFIRMSLYSSEHRTSFSFLGFIKHAQSGDHGENQWLETLYPDLQKDKGYQYYNRYGHLFIVFVLSLYLHFIHKLKPLQKFLSIQKYYINHKEWKDSDEYNYLLERVSNQGCRKWKNDFVEFKLFLLGKCKSNWKDGVSFKIQMAQVPYSRSWRKEHLSCTATTYEHLKIDNTKTVYTSCVLHCEYNFDGLCYVQNKKRSCTFLSNKRFTWEGQKLSWNWDMFPLL